MNDQNIQSLESLEKEDDSGILSWDEYFLNIAKAVSLRSACLRASVGAVIVNPHKKIVSTGYNSPPHGVLDCKRHHKFCNRERLGFTSGEGYEHSHSLHAEQNAIIQSGADRAHLGTIYVFGRKFICILCQRFIVQAGIARVVIQAEDNAPILEIDPNSWIASL